MVYTFNSLKLNHVLALLIKFNDVFNLKMNTKNLTCNFFSFHFVVVFVEHILSHRCHRGGCFYVLVKDLFISNQRLD